jgi:hypothetical protein
MPACWAQRCSPGRSLGRAGKGKDDGPLIKLKKLDATK